MLEIYFKRKLRCENERKVEMDIEHHWRRQSICEDRVDGHFEIGHTTLKKWLYIYRTHITATHIEWSQSNRIRYESIAHEIWALTVFVILSFHKKNVLCFFVVVLRAILEYIVPFVCGNTMRHLLHHTYFGHQKNESMRMTLRIVRARMCAFVLWL